MLSVIHPHCCSKAAITFSHLLSYSIALYQRASLRKFRQVVQPTRDAIQQTSISPSGTCCDSTQTHQATLPSLMILNYSLSFKTHKSIRIVY